MFLFLFLKYSLTASNLYAVENLNRDIKIDKYKEKIEKIFTDQVCIEDVKNTESSIFCISVPRNKSLYYIDKIKNILNSNKIENETFYYREISKICDDVFQGFNRNIEFIDEFLDFSLFYKKYPSNVKINDFNRHSFSFAIKFSESKSADCEYINCKYGMKKINNEQEDEKNIPDLYMITDLSESYENYLIVREKLQEDINDFYSSPEIIFVNAFKLFGKNDPAKLDKIKNMFFNKSFIMKEGNIWDFIFRKKFKDVKYYFKQLLDLARKKNRDEKTIDNSTVDDKNKEINDLKNIYHFFINISENEWIDAINSIQNYITKYDHVHIFGALNNKNAKKLKEYLDLIYEEIRDSFYDLNDFLFSYYTFNKRFSNKRNRSRIKNCYLKLVSKKKNFKNRISKNDLSLICLNSEDSFSRLFFYNDCIFKLHDIFKDMDNPISNGNLNLCVNDWVLIFKNSNLSNLNDLEIYTINPYLQKFVDINVFQWFEYQIKNIIDKDSFLSIYRKHILFKLYNQDNGFIGYNRKVHYRFSCEFSFYMRDDFYRSFINMFLNLVKKKDIKIEKSYITDNSMCFKPMNLKNFNLKTFSCKEHELIYNQRKNILDNPNNSLRINIANPWIRSQMEFLFLLKANDGTLAKVICNIQIQEATTNFIKRNPLLITIENIFYVLLIKDFNNDSFVRSLYRIFCKKNILLLTIGAANKICRIFYETNLKNKRFIKALDILISTMLYESYIDLNSLPGNETFHHDLNYVEKLIEGLKNQIINRMNFKTPKEYFYDFSDSTARISFHFDSQYTSIDWKNNIIFKSFYNYKWKVE